MNDAPLLGEVTASQIADIAAIDGGPVDGRLDIYERLRWVNGAVMKATGAIRLELAALDGANHHVGRRISMLFHASGRYHFKKLFIGQIPTSVRLEKW